MFSKAVGKALGISPKKLNYVLDQYSGVLGDFLLPVLTPQAERGMFEKALHGGRHEQQPCKRRLLR